jgi:hypothetical protein
MLPRMTTSRRWTHRDRWIPCGRPDRVTGPEGTAAGQALSVASLLDAARVVTTTWGRLRTDQTGRGGGVDRIVEWNQVGT